MWSEWDRLLNLLRKRSTIPRETPSIISSQKANSTLFNLLILYNNQSGVFLLSIIKIGQGRVRISTYHLYRSSITLPLLQENTKNQEISIFGYMESGNLRGCKFETYKVSKKYQRQKRCITQKREGGGRKRITHTHTQKKIVARVKIWESIGAWLQKHHNQLCL